MNDEEAKDVFTDKVENHMQSFSFYIDHIQMDFYDYYDMISMEFFLVYSAKFPGSTTVFGFVSFRDLNKHLTGESFRGWRVALTRDKLSKFVAETGLVDKIKHSLSL